MIVDSDKLMRAATRAVMSLADRWIGEDGYVYDRTLVAFLTDPKDLLPKKFSEHDARAFVADVIDSGMLREVRGVVEGTELRGRLVRGEGRAA